jgi:1,4-dihydroxy-2-naphthoate octaprenyltransferase
VLSKIAAHFFRNADHGPAQSKNLVLEAFQHSRTKRTTSMPDALTFRDWFFALRPWSFTAAAAPVCLGSAMGAVVWRWNTGLFLLTLAGGIALQAGTNLYNTYGDYKSGVDTLESAVTCPQLVTGQMTPSQLAFGGRAAFGFAGLIGLLLARLCGPVPLLFGILGVIAGYMYTNGVPYKYYGLGPFFVALLMGPLMVLPSYYIQTGSFALAPALGSLSIACLVSAIMHANDLRDIEHDRAAGIRTLAMNIGVPLSLRLHKLFLLGAFVFAGLNALLGVLPWTCLGVFSLLPKAISELRKMSSDNYNFSGLERWTAIFHMQFCMLLAALTALYAMLRVFGVLA